MGELKVDIVRTNEMSEGDWDLWRAMTAADPALNSPYFRPEFTQVAGQVSPGAAVAVLSRDGATVGFFPFQRRGGAIQPLGAPMNDYHGVIARAGEAPSLAEIARVLGAPRMNMTAWVGDVGETHEATAPSRRTVQVQMGDDGYDGWYRERRATFGKFFKDKERAQRSMVTESGAIRIESGLRDPALLTWLIDLKRDQYRRTARHDIFGCGWTVELLEALLQTDTPDFGGELAGLWAGDRLAAVEYSLRGGDQCHFWFPGYDPAMARCSPGILLTMGTMQQASVRGIRTFDFGFEGEHYKKYFCNAARDVREVLVLKPGIGASLSQAAVGALNLAGQGRGERLRNSVRRRWAAIEACEVTPANRFKGGLQAAGAAFAKLTRSDTDTVPA